MKDIYGQIDDFYPLRDDYPSVKPTPVNMRLIHNWEHYCYEVGWWIQIAKGCECYNCGQKE